MRRSFIAALLLAAALPTVAAAQTIDERQANILRRIDEGVRAGALTREEARRLRAEFDAIERLERQYRRDGLDQWERRDLNQRLDALSRGIDAERRDSERLAQGLIERRRQLDQNMRDGIRGGGLTRYEADQLYTELAAYDRQYDAYRRSGDGLDAREREELRRRLEQIAQRILNERRDGEKAGPGRW